MYDEDYGVVYWHGRAIGQVKEWPEGWYAYWGSTTLLFEALEQALDWFRDGDKGHVIVKPWF